MMSVKHRSLDARTNAVLAIMWLLVCGTLAFLFPSSRLWVALIIGGLVGAVCGRLQVEPFAPIPINFATPRPLFLYAAR
jgi:hypothetical protein